MSQPEVQRQVRQQRADIDALYEHRQVPQPGLRNIADASYPTAVCRSCVPTW